MLLSRCVYGVNGFFYYRIVLVLYEFGAAETWPAHHLDQTRQVLHGKQKQAQRGQYWMTTGIFGVE